jgi:hypothetical protein
MGKRVFAVLFGTLIGAVAVFMGLLVAGLRWQLGPVVDAVRRLNRSVTNPRVMRTAGTAGAQTSIIRHIGRTSGRTFETPVDTIETTSGLLIVATSDVAGMIPGRTMRTLRLFGVSHCLHLEKS